ncbi:MAG: class I SAM-dependent methyltransferase [Smithella sp.]
MAFRNGVEKACYDLYWKAEKKIVPGLEFSQTLYEKTLFNQVNGAKRWLDLGCGHAILPQWRPEAEKKLTSNGCCIIGLDYDLWSLQHHRSIKNLIRGDISSLPFPSDSFDLITSNMVFEHLQEPDVQLKEIHRILRPGGKLVFHTPCVKGYWYAVARIVPESWKGWLSSVLHGRKDEDIFPAFYRINTGKRIKALAEKTGFRAQVKHIVSAAQLQIVPPLAIIELLIIKAELRFKWLRSFRSNIIAVLYKPYLPSVHGI